MINYATSQIQPYKYEHTINTTNKITCIQAVVTSVIPALQSISQSYLHFNQ